MKQSEAQMIGDLFQRVSVELRAARKKFPENKAIGYALAEEVGEVYKAILHYKFEGKATKEDVQGEVVQAITMLCRLWIDGDSSIDLEPVGSEM